MRSEDEFCVCQGLTSSSPFRASKVPVAVSSSSPACSMPKLPEVTAAADGPLMLIGIGETEAKEVSVLSNDEVKEQEEALAREEARQEEEQRALKAKIECARLWSTHDWTGIMELAGCNSEEEELMYDLLKIKLNLSEEGEAAEAEEAALKAQNDELLEASDW